MKNEVSAWVQRFNQFPSDMVERLMTDSPTEWREVSVPGVGDSIDCCKGSGEIQRVVGDKVVVERWDDRKFFCIDCEECCVTNWTFPLPMWGWMWQFSDFYEDYWLENENGIRIMSDYGFRIFEHDYWGFFFGIDGAGYDFYAEHWIPLYKAIFGK
jgi:hypothetical protein